MNIQNLDKLECYMQFKADVLAMNKYLKILTRALHSV